MLKHRHRTRLWLALGLLTLGVSLLPLQPHFNEQTLTRAVQAVGSYGGILFVLVFSLVTSLGFPGNVMTVVGGALFGLVWGSLWSVLGATAGAIGAFWLGRYLLHDWFEARFGHHPLLRRLQASIARQPLNFVIAVRFTPISPFSLVNFLFGLTPLTLRTYALGTLVGIIPSTIAYAWIGASGQRALSGDRLSLYLALGCLSLLAILPMLVKARSRPN